MSGYATLRRIGIIGDVHAEDGLLEAALTYLNGVTPHLDALLCTGDVVTGQGDAGRCITLLREADVVTVRGNHDRWFGQDSYEWLPHFTPAEEIDAEKRAWLEELPPTWEADTLLGPLLLCHGIGTDDMNGVYPRDSDAVVAALHPLHALYGEEHIRWIVCGHTHQRMKRTFDHLTILNAGTLRRDRGPGFLIADFVLGSVTMLDINPRTKMVTIQGETLLL